VGGVALLAAIVFAAIGLVLWQRRRRNRDASNDVNTGGSSSSNVISNAATAAAAAPPQLAQSPKPLSDTKSLPRVPPPAAMGQCFTATPPLPLGGKEQPQPQPTYRAPVLSAAATTTDGPHLATRPQLQIPRPPAALQRQNLLPLPQQRTDGSAAVGAGLTDAASHFTPPGYQQATYVPQPQPPLMARPTPPSPSPINEPLKQPQTPLYEAPAHKG
jgi:hypothetical protein